MRCLWTFLGLALNVCGSLTGAASGQEKVSVAPARPIDAIAIRDALRPVLSIAASGEKNAPTLIEQHLGTLLGKTDNDPRLHYVHALSLLKNFRHADATRAMHAAADHRIYYFPVHHFLIYEQIRQKHYDEAIESLVDLAERIGDPAQLWTSEDDRLEAAHWLGRMIGFLEGPCSSPDAAKRMSHVEPALRILTGPIYETEINRGLDELHAEHREMQMLLLAAVDTAGQKKAEELKAAEEKQQALDAQKKSISTSAREQEAIHKEQLREYESQLKALEKKYDALEISQERLTATMASVRMEIAQLPSLAKAMNDAGQFNQTFRGRLTEDEVNTAIAAKSLELQGYILEYQSNSNKQAETLRQAERLIASGRQFQAASANAEAKIQATLRGLGRWENRLAKSKKSVVQNSDRRTIAVRSRIALISSYDALNVSDEIADLQRSVADVEVGL